jgi:hypothetical protein
MDIFLASIAVVGIALLVSVIWFMRWLKLNYPKSYADPAMAGIGGTTAFLVLSRQQLKLQEPYHVLVAAVPMYFILSFMSAGVLSRQLTYASTSLLALLSLAAATYWFGLKGWVMYTGAFAVFLVLWVALFRWRYVHNKSN